MIHVAITCAKSSRSVGAPDCGCPEFHTTLAPDLVEQWAEDTLRENGWHVDDHDAYYCPAHNPTDAGTPVALIRSEYRPLGASGWEARLPDSFTSSTIEFGIEIRLRHGGDVVEEPAVGATVADSQGWRWTREHTFDPDMPWVHRHHEGSETVSWQTLLARGPLRIVERDRDDG